MDETYLNELRAALQQPAGRWWDIHEDGSHHEAQEGSPYLVINRASISAVVAAFERHRDALIQITKYADEGQGWSNQAATIARTALAKSSHKAGSGSE